ncbi:MAG: glycosyltransferase family 9 protein [Acidobacteria bacterium]|nr:glycosyltransferase family 9 protein [Acidobacteriota bacterium]
MHFLIVKLSAIGDVVHTLPAVAALRRAYPNSRITWIAERAAANILLGNTTIDELIIIDTKSWRKKFWQPIVLKEVIQTVKKLHSNKIDIAFDFQGLLKSGLIALISGSKKRVGFSDNGLREKASRLFLSNQVNVDDKLHIIEKNLQLIKSLEIENAQPYEFPISVSSEDTEYINNLLLEYNLKEFAIINPGGGWPTKIWSPKYFGQLSDWLWEHYQLTSLVTFGPGEEILAQSVVKASSLGHTYQITTNLKQFVALARKATIFIGGDTGPLHLAAASKTPIVGIYGPTLANRNGPFDAKDITVGLDLSCRIDCHRRKCPTNNECMDIPLKMVISAVEKRLPKIKLWQINKNSSAALASH